MSKKFYVATAIPYVNGRPHLGNAILHLYADILARYERQQDSDVFFSAGTDEHGGKIEESAQKAGKTTQQFADEVSELFRGGLKKLDITYDRFIRTTDAAHEERAAIIWRELKDDIYKDSYTAMYCTGCEEFKTDSVVKDTNGVCPNHNRAYEKIQEENYFFRLSKYGEAIQQAIESGEFVVYPEARRNEILGVLREGLEDISISRAASSVSWGIPVPGDDSQIMYVWFEALMNYITTLGYPENDDFTRYWPADMQVIGKDILRFHAAIWPAMLLGLGLPLPKQLYVHGFVTHDGQKMSKSLGNVVDPLDVVEKYGNDAFRYFFAKYGPIVSDMDFNWPAFERAYNNELANELGNAVSRVAAMIRRYQEGVIGEVAQAEHDTNEYHEALAVCRFDRAIEAVWLQVRAVNQYIEETKPWAIAKEGDAEHLQSVLAESVNSLLEIADLLVPFMPDTARKIAHVFESGVVRDLPDGARSLFPKHDTKES